MIIPNMHINRDGDIVFEITHLSESKKELKKDILSRKIYKNWVTVDSIEENIINFECECYDFQVNRHKDLPCKHLKQTIDLLRQYGIKLPKQKDGDYRLQTKQ